MSEEMAVVEQFIDQIQRGSAAVQSELLAPDLVVHMADQPVTGRGPVLLLAGAALDAFSDVQLHSEIVAESPGVVVAAFDVRGKQQRELFGIAPTGLEARVEGVAVFRLSGSAISDVRLCSDMSYLFRKAGTGAPAAGGPGEEPGITSAETTIARDVWLAGVGALAAAEEYGIRLFNSLIERGKAWEPAVKPQTTRAAETLVAARSAATDVVRGLGDKLKSAKSTGETAIAQFVAGRSPESPTREEFEALKRQVETLTAQLGAERPAVTTSGSTTD
jgi:poly(hydroxyalkanoate) granule-associated protein